MFSWCARSFCCRKNWKIVCWLNCLANKRVQEITWTFFLAACFNSMPLLCPFYLFYSVHLFNLYFLFSKVLIKLYMITQGMHNNYLSNGIQCYFWWHWYGHYIFIYMHMRTHINIHTACYWKNVKSMAYTKTKTVHFSIWSIHALFGIKFQLYFSNYYFLLLVLEIRNEIQTNKKWVKKWCCYGKQILKVLCNFTTWGKY